MLAGALTALAAGTLLMAGPAGWRAPLRAGAEDAIMRLAMAGGFPGSSTPGVAVVEIDDAALARFGPWPWPRERLAQLVNRIADEKPAVLGLDLLLAGPDSRSPVLELRRRGIPAGDPVLTAIESRIPDGDRALRAALARAPAVLGVALDIKATGPAAKAPFLTTGPVGLESLWRAPGVIAPEVVAPEQSGLGVMALPADADGVVRRLPLVAEAAGTLHPGLALEMLRVMADSSAYVLSGPPRTLMVGATRLALPGDGLLRLVPGQAPPRGVSAAALLDGAPQGLAGKVVLLGATAAELGGLRLSSDDTLTPSVWIHAQAVRQLSAGLSPVTPRHAMATEGGLAVVTALAGAALPVIAAPVIAWFAAVLLGLVILAGAIMAFATAGVLFNPLTPMIVLALAFSASALATFAVMRRHAALIRRRFEQHLSPDVVARIAQDPAQAKLAGERRQITALFTDIENFTAFCEAAGPELLVGVLDRYFEGVVAIILRHGGTVDKIVGDAVHAFFNAPLDLEGHAARAIACASEIVVWTEAFRAEGAAARLAFGRTRIGIESGDAVVGDVGVGAKLDYTAHGYAVNAAARLEGANKDFGTDICVGPGTADLVPQGLLRALGSIQLRGHSRPVTVWTVQGTPAGP